MKENDLKKEIDELKSQLEEEQRNNKVLQELASSRLVRVNQLEVEAASYKVALSEQSKQEEDKHGIINQSKHFIKWCIND